MCALEQGEQPTGAASHSQWTWEGPWWLLWSSYLTFRWKRLPLGGSLSPILQVLYIKMHFWKRCFSSTQIITLLGTVINEGVIIALVPMKVWACCCMEWNRLPLALVCRGIVERSLVCALAGAASQWAPWGTFFTTHCSLCNARLR